MLAHDEILSSVSQLYQMKGSNACHYTDQSNGKLSVEISVNDWYSISKSQFSGLGHDMSFYIDRDRPMVMMYFQTKGTAEYRMGQSVRIREQHHSLSYLSQFKSEYYIPAGSYSQHFCIKIEPYFILDQLQEVEPDDPVVKFFHKRDDFVTITNPQRISPAIQQLIEDFNHCPYKGKLGEFYKENIVRTLLVQQLAAFFGTGAIEGKSDTKLSKRDMDLLHDIKTYLDQHYLEVTSLQSLSRKFCVNTFKLKYGFKKLFDIPVMKYIDEHKMNYARNLLVQPNVAVNDIADELGYQHYNNFSTAFKRKFGYSPGSISRLTPTPLLAERG